ncbi:MAG TPA: hypothetical protein VG674_25820 [Amycolatopsis sp.]|nr:hypothetical protein [Amycolatopsis sp.]
MSTPNGSAVADLELSLLQLLRLKGRLKATDVPASLDHGAGKCSQVLESSTQAGHCVQNGPSVKLTPDGRQRLAELLEVERAGVDQAQLEALYHRFDEHNSAFKAIITSWQMRDENTPNDHTDADYDQGVLDRIAQLHASFAPLLDEIVATVPRLAHYPARFAEALARIQAGEHHFVARPIIDSYHTVWFELHEELIGLLGRNRADEAAAGRAV